jgi:hypothetical protein
MPDGLSAAAHGAVGDQMVDQFKGGDSMRDGLSMTARGIRLRGNNPSQQMPNNFMSLIEMRVECNRKCRKRKRKERKRKMEERKRKWEEQRNDNNENGNNNDNNENDNNNDNGNNEKDNKNDGVPNKCIKEHGLKGAFEWEGTAYYPFKKAEGFDDRTGLGKRYINYIKKRGGGRKMKVLTDAMSGKRKIGTKMRKFLNMGLVTHDPDNKKTVYKYDCTDEDQKNTQLCRMLREDTETCDCKGYETRVLKALGCTGVDAQKKCTIDAEEYELIDKEIEKNGGKLKITPNIVNKLLEGTRGQLKFMRIMLTIECKGEQLKFSLGAKSFDVEEANDEIEDTTRRRRLLNRGRAGC